MKKGLIIGIIIVLAIGLAIGGVWFFHVKEGEKIEVQEETTSESPEMVQAQQNEKTNLTDKVASFEPESEANPLLVGLWRDDSNPQHYKAYYDDACDEESYFWGKEWDESEGVYEEYLSYHGNGWFKWSKTQSEIIEINVADQENMVVPVQYIIDELNDSVYIYSSFKLSESASHKVKKIPFRTYTFHRL